MAVEVEDEHDPPYSLLRDVRTTIVDHSKQAPRPFARRRAAEAGLCGGGAAKRRAARGGAGSDKCALPNSARPSVRLAGVTGDVSSRALLLGLTVLSNTAYLKCTGLLLEAGVPKLLHRLVCNEETGEA